MEKSRDLRPGEEGSEEEGKEKKVLCIYLRVKYTFMKCVLALPHFQVRNRKFLNVFEVCFLIFTERNKIVLLQEYFGPFTYKNYRPEKLLKLLPNLKFMKNHFLMTFNFLIFLNRNLTNRSI